jgi:hypothetical protein
MSAPKPVTQRTFNSINGQHDERSSHSVAGRRARAGVRVARDARSNGLALGFSRARTHPGVLSGGLESRLRRSDGAVLMRSCPSSTNLGPISSVFPSTAPGATRRFPPRANCTSRCSPILSRKARLHERMVPIGPTTATASGRCLSSIQAVRFAGVTAVRLASTPELMEFSRRSSRCRATKRTLADDFSHSGYAP